MPFACTPMNLVASAAHALRMAMRRTSAGSASSSFILPFFTSSPTTRCSMGRPWQSQPGVYGTRMPSMSRLRTTMSFSTLFTMWPTWIGPLAYGGPSWKRKCGAPARSRSRRSYRPMASQRASEAGSLCDRLAFMAKSVCGRFSVFLKSAMGGPRF